jgi:hypothetical protein
MDSDPDYISALRRRLSSALDGKVSPDEKGWVLYSGLDTLRPGKYYLMGFNPAKDDANELLTEHSAMPANWSAYTQQCWHCEKSKCIHRDEMELLKPSALKPHQVRVNRLVKELGLRPEQIFSANAIFVESEGTGELKARSAQLWDAFWPVHQWFLSIVRPETIICLGNGESDSSFDLLRRRAQTWDVVFGSKNYRDGKIVSAMLPLLDGEHLSLKVFGIPHPSLPGIERAIPRIKEFSL